MISNLPAIILKMRNISDTLFIFGEVISVVVTAETDLKSESIVV